MPEITESLPKELAKDKESGNYTELFADIEKYLANSTDIKQTVAEANAFLQSQNIIPEITILGYDEDPLDKNGGGIRIQEGDEKYTLDPDTGIARDSNGNIQAFFYPNGTVQRFDYDDSGNLIRVIDANGGKYEKDPTTNTWTDPDGNQVKAPEIDKQKNCLILKTDSGGTEEHYADGSALIKDKDGKVIGVMSAIDPTDNEKGRNLHMVEFDDKGNPIKVTISSPDKPDTPPQQWELQKDGSWKRTVPASPPAESNADFKFDQTTGAITIKNKDGSEEKYNRNGTSTIKNVDGSVIEKDRFGNPVKITRPGQKDIDITWNNGKPEKMVVGSDTYRRVGDHWEGPGGTTYKDVIVHPNGDVEIRGDLITQLWKTDGYTVIKDTKANRPTSILGPDGKPVKQFEYDKNTGVLNKVVLNGTTYALQADGSWVQVGPGAGDERFQISVDANGNASVKDKNNVVTHFWNDGTSTTTYPSGDAEYYDQKGALVKFKSGGKEYTIVSKDEIVGPNGTWKFENGAWFFYDLSGWRQNTCPPVPKPPSRRL